MPFPTEMLGFVASESSKSGELLVTADHSAAVGATFMIASTKADRTSREVTAARPSASIVLDTRRWTNRFATVSEPVADDHDLFGLEEKARTLLTGARAAAMLTPSFFVAVDSPEVLRHVVRAVTGYEEERLVPHVATDAAYLEADRLADFLRILEVAGDRRLAFTFAGRNRPLEKRSRLAGLRQLLSARPGSWILEVDALVGADALAHGAGWVGVGASSSRRWPRRPGDDGFATRAVGGLPGLFLRELLEFRSPDVYADWYGDTPTPFCQRCGRHLDQFDATEEGRRSVIAHNLHAIRDFALELFAEPSSARRSWLAEQREQAVRRHQRLTTAATSRPDQTLQNLCWLERAQPDGARIRRWATQPPGA